VRAPWRSGVVLVCRECKGARGFGPKQVRAGLRQRAKAEHPHRKAVRVLAVPCLDVCPQRAVTVATFGVRETTVVVSGPNGCATVIDQLADALGDESSPDR
jgi:hypothetical protein